MLNGQGVNFLLLILFLGMLSSCSESTDDPDMMEEDEELLDMCSKHIDFRFACSADLASTSFDQFPSELQEVLAALSLNTTEVVGFTTTLCDPLDTLNFVQDRVYGDTTWIFDLCFDHIATMILVNGQDKMKEDIEHVVGLEVSRIEYIWEIFYNDQPKEFLAGVEHDKDNPTCPENFCMYQIDADFEMACSVCP